MQRQTLTLDIRPGGLGLRRVNVRSDLSVAGLLAAIADKFNLDGEFELRQTASGAPLPSEAPLAALALNESEALVCARVIRDTGTAEMITRGDRLSFSRAFERVYVQELRTLAEYDLTWQPAILGRRDHRHPVNNQLLAVDLEDLESLPTVSRQHVCLTERDGSFFIEAIQDRNPAYMDGVPLTPYQQFALRAGSVLQLGQVSLAFHVVSG